MIQFPGMLMTMGSSRTGIAPASLLDIQTVDGYLYYWADRALSGIPAAITANNEPASVNYQPFLMSAPNFTFYKSLQTDVGTFSIQNTGGDTFGPDYERVTRLDALEGAMFVYRYWQVAAEAAWLEVHGTLNISDTVRPVAELTGYQLFRGEDDTPAGTWSESCQLVWGEKRCGATGDVECLYSYKTCQVTDHYQGLLINYEKNYSETIAAVPLQTINRRRAI